MISAADLHSTFNRLIDEFQTDNFVEQEVDSFLTEAQMIVFKQFVHPDPAKSRLYTPGVNAYFESNNKMSEYIKPFKREVEDTSTADAEILISVLDALNPTRTIYGVNEISVKGPGDTEYIPAVWKSETQAQKQKRMAFYSPNICNPWYTIKNDKYQLYPNDLDELDYELHYTLMPEPIELSTSAGSDFHEVLRLMICWKAVELAGSSIRDQQIVQYAQNMYNQSGV